MDIVVGNTVQINKDPDNTARKIKRLESFYAKDRRKNRTDRRKSYREGLFVSISTREERRVSRDRRNL